MNPTRRISRFSQLERNQNGAINLKVHFHIKENRLRSFPDSDRSNEAIYFHDRENPRSRTADGRCVRKLKRKTFLIMVLSLNEGSFICISCSGIRPSKTPILTPVNCLPSILCTYKSLWIWENLFYYIFLQFSSRGQEPTACEAEGRGSNPCSHLSIFRNLSKFNLI